VLYYVSRQAMWKTTIACSGQSAIFLGISCIEFWLIMGLHIGLIFAMNIEAFSDRVGEWNFDWTALGASQFFLTFFVTFYNGHCYKRLLRIYDCSMEVLDDGCLLAQELVVSMPSQDLLRHRVQTMKYILAAIHIFFFHLAGGPTRKHWRELSWKGLLSQDEIVMLLDYAPGEFSIVHVLAVWAMQVLENGLRNHTLWTSRSQRIAHVYNRMDGHVLALLQAMEDLIEIIALPVPYQYYHMMNVMVLVNCLIFAVAAAVNFRTYVTVFPMAVLCIFMLSIREVAISSATPFGTEADTALPISKFLQYAYDTTTCLIMCFAPPEATRVTTLVEGASMFTSKQLLGRMTQEAVYRPEYEAISSSMVHWSREMPISSMISTMQSPAEILSKVIKTPDPKTDFHMTATQNAHKRHQARTPQERRSSLVSLNSALVSIPEEELFPITAQELQAEADREQQRADWIENLRAEVLKVQKENEMMAEEAQRLRNRLEYAEKHFLDLEAKGGKLPPEVAMANMKRTKRLSLEDDNEVIKAPSVRRLSATAAEAVETKDAEQFASGKTVTVVVDPNHFDDFGEALEKVQVLAQAAEQEDNNQRERSGDDLGQVTRKKSDRKSPSKSPRPARRHRVEPHLPPLADELGPGPGRSQQIPSGKEHRAAKVPISGKVSLPVSRSLVSVSPTASTKAPSESDAGTIGGATVLREVEGELERPGDYWLV